MHYGIKRLVDFPKLKFKMAGWFHEKCGIPKALYEENMDQCLEGKEPYPQWYAVMDGDTIIGGPGVIENDFHDRKNLKPNVCAVYVEKDYRNRGIAKAMLNFVCEDMKERGIETLYLLTDHTSFYEKCGWEFLCFAQGDHDNHQSRMYIHKA